MQVEAVGGQLSGPEVVILIEALDAVIPFKENTRHLTSENERFTWHAHDALRSRLKRAVGMSFYDAARDWLDAELKREREATTDKLFSRLAELMRDPKATRRTVREGFVQCVRDLRDYAAVAAQAAQLADLLDERRASSYFPK